MKCIVVSTVNACIANKNGIINYNMTCVCMGFKTIFFQINVYRALWFLSLCTTILYF